MYDLRPFWNFTELHEVVGKCEDLCRTLSNGVDVQTYYKLYYELNRQCHALRYITIGSEEALQEAAYNNEVYTDDVNWFLDDFYPQADKLLGEIMKLGRNFYGDDYEDGHYRQNAWNLFHVLKSFEDLIVIAINTLA